MAEERTLGLARAPEQAADDLSKEELQRRMDEARDSISHTVTEIKETVANQYQAVKDTLDWREQFKKRPVAWSAGALGVGFLVGYGIAATVKGDGNGHHEDAGFIPSRSHAYAAQPVLGAAAAASMRPQTTSENGKDEDEGPGILDRLKTTPAYGRVRSEVAGIGNSFLDELSKTAKQIIVPAVMKSIKDFIGGHLPGSTQAKATRADTNRTQPRTDSTYQPVLEHNQR
jgi:hypothetical protein